MAYIEATTLNKILDLVIRMLKGENKIILKNPYKAYNKGKLIVNSNYNVTNTHYTKFGNYILLNLFRLVKIDRYKNIKYLFTLLDIVIKWLNFYLLKIKIKEEVFKAF